MKDLFNLSKSGVFFLCLLSLVFITEAKGNYEYVMENDFPAVPYTPVDYPTPFFADMDADGDLDFIMGDISAAVKYFENDNGVFDYQLDLDTDNLFIIYPSIHPIGASPAPVMPTLADFDNDGDLDLVVGNDDGHLYYFRNLNPYFEFLVNSDDPFSNVTVGNHSAPAAIDLDEDGDMDLVVGDDNSTFHTFENTGSGFVELTGANNPFGTYGFDVGSYASPTFGDADRDGDLDMVVGIMLGRLYFYENVNTVFSLPTIMFNGLDVGSWSRPHFVDLDDDGDDDLVVANKEGHMYYFENTTSGLEQVVNTHNILEGEDIGSFAIGYFADVDSDGDEDFISGEYYGMIFYYENTESGFVERTGSDNPFDGIDVGDYSAPALADIDGDGDLDLLVGKDSGEVEYYQNTESGFSLYRGSDNPFSSIDVGDHSIPVFHDVDSDGDLDLVIGERDGTLSYYQKHADSYIYVSGSDSPFDGIDVGVYSCPRFADIDQDGDVDLVLGVYGSTHGGIVAYYEKTILGFVEKTGEDNPFDKIYLNGRTSVALSDLDGDGYSELTIGHYSGKFYHFTPRDADRDGSHVYLDCDDNNPNIYPTDNDADCDGEPDVVETTTVPTDTDDKTTNNSNNSTSSNEDAETTPADCRLVVVEMPQKQIYGVGLMILNFILCVSVLRYKSRRDGAL